jgi:hypothetical protein
MRFQNTARTLVALSLASTAGVAAFVGRDRSHAESVHAAPAQKIAAPSNGPLTVIELFQSQGCSSCPPANANVNALAASRSDVLALSFGVTYWDKLGWKDTFAKPEYTARQWAYARARGRGNVWTPQVYVNGRDDVVGANPAQLTAAVARAKPLAATLRVAQGRVAVASGAAPVGGADILLVRYEPRAIDVPIRAGENGGRTLPHRNIVRQLLTIGRWTGSAISVPLPVAPRPGLAQAVLLQRGAGGPIIAAAKVNERPL